MQWEWKLDTRMVVGSGPKLELDGVSAGKHSVVCYARNGNWLALDSVNVDVPPGGASPAGAPASVPGGPTAKPPTGPGAVIASDGVPVPIFTLSRTDPKATLYARCAQLYYAMAIIWYVTMSEDEDVGLGRPEDGTVLGPQAGSTLAVLTLILGALCRSAGVDLNKDPPAARTLASGGEAGGKALLRVDRGALRVTGQQPGLEWQVETPAGRVDAAGLSDFTVGYSTKHRRVVAVAHAGSLTLTPAQAGAAAVRVPPGGRVQWELGGGTPASGATSTPGASGAPAVPGFAGRWKTTWGDWGQITLQSAGNRVWGFYGGDGTQATADGVMEGTVSGRTARLRWQVRNGQLWGGAMFVLS
ncbi:MAG: hypothetical protein JNN08_22400, partial [Bryobacterales bacterium]|nr:hypothetical protein [Bryobacterales bacterium]